MAFVFEDTSGRRWQRLKWLAAAAVFLIGLVIAGLLVLDEPFLNAGVLWGLLQITVFLLLCRFTLAGALSAVQWLRTRTRRRRPYCDPVSVVIAAHDEADVISRTLETLLLTEGPELEVIVVDDGSHDETGALVGHFADRGVRLVSQPHAGKAEALRRGFAVARHTFVVTIDADTLVTSTTIGHLTAPFRDRRVGAVAGNLKVGNQLNLLTRLQSLDYLLTLNLERRAYALLHCVPVMPGALSAWRRRLVDELGGFTNDTSAEDTDMTLTLAKAGYQTAYAPRAIGLTEAPESLAALVAQRTRWSFGTLQSLWKHRQTMPHVDANAFTRAVMLSMWTAQVMMPLLSILMYLMLLASPFTGRLSQILIATAAYNGVFLVFATWALAIEGESLARLPLAAAFNVIFRPLSDVIALKVMLVAARGEAVQWRRVVKSPAPVLSPDDIPDPAAFLLVEDLVPAGMVPAA